eukprot:g3245.t1
MLGPNLGFHPLGLRRGDRGQAQLQACDFPLPLRLVKASEDFVTFGEMRRFRAAVLFPWDPTLMAFYELYRLNTVLLLPRSGWIFKVQFFTGWIWSQPLGALEFAHLAAARGVESPPYPWWRPEASDPETVLYWYAFSDCQRLPHLLRFGSFSELFLQLLDTDRLRRARRKMQRHNRRALAVGLRVLATAEGHACRSPPCSRDLDSCKVNGNCCADLMFEMLVDFSRFLTRQNVTFMVSEGTLLGAVRDQDIIPYTADLDIFVPREGWERAMLINEERFRRKSYHMMVDPDQPHCARLCAVWQGFPVNRAPFDQHFQWDTEKVGNDLAYFMDIYDEEMDFAQATKHLIYPASTVMIRNISFPAPREQDAWERDLGPRPFAPAEEIYVEARYGPNWRVPDHQARELAEKYPTLEEAKVWSTNMLLLHAAQRDIQMGYRLLERATVDYKTGDIVIRSGDRPRQLAKKLVLEDFQTSDGHVTGGKITIYPPEHDEFQIVDYVLYWAKEEVSTWSDEITLKRIDSGMDTLEDANKEREEESGGSEWGYRPARPLGRIWRCKNVEDPFKRCSQRGIPLQVTIPHEIKVPEDATHLAAAAAVPAARQKAQLVQERAAQTSASGARGRKPWKEGLRRKMLEPRIPLRRVEELIATLHPEQRAVVDLALDGQNIFLTGLPGSGKSYVLKQLVQLLQHRDGLPSVGDWEEAAENPKVHERLGALKTLVIDEVSMLSGEFLDRANELICRVRGGKVFGGLQVIFCGDFLQLPPMKREVMAFEANAWSELQLKCITLQQKLGSAALAENQRRLEALPGDEHAYEATDSFELPGSTARQALQHGRFEKLLKLKVGAVVMLLVNKRLPHRCHRGAPRAFSMPSLTSGGALAALEALAKPNQMMALPEEYRETPLVNGSVGVVVGFETSPELPDDATAYPVVEFAKGLRVTVTPVTDSGELGFLGQYERRQLPLKLAWALTVHKMQGLTLRSENPALTTVRLSGEEPETEGDPFSRKVIFGLLQGFEAERCKAGGHTLEKEVWESIVAKMVMKTNKAMKATTTDYCGVACQIVIAHPCELMVSLEDCKAAGTKQRFAAALQHMTTATMSYHPSEALTLDDVSIFAYVNGAISSFRRGSFATFGRDLGGMLKELVPSEAITTELQEEAPRPSGLKLRPVE